MMWNRIWIFFAILMLVFVRHPRSADATVSVTTKNEPNVIAIGPFFNGMPLTVTGEVDAANDVVVLVSGGREDLTLKKKGKVLGLLWMNLGDVHFKNVPSLYLLYTSPGVKASSASETKNRERLEVGFEYLIKKMEIEAPLEARDKLANEFLKLKQKEELYASHPGEIVFDNKNEAQKHFTARIWIPPKIPIGEYQVTVMEIYHGRIVDISKHQLTVKEEGILLLLSKMAYNHSLAYGLIAVLIAVIAGLAMDFFFGTGKGGGAH